MQTRVIHVAEEYTRQTTVGHIFGANFSSHAVVTYMHIAHDTYVDH